MLIVKPRTPGWRHFSGGISSGLGVDESATVFVNGSNANEVVPSGGQAQAFVGSALNHV